jgi:hypothetical protein
MALAWRWKWCMSASTAGATAGRMSPGGTGRRRRGSARSPPAGRSAAGPAGAPPPGDGAMRTLSSHSRAASKAAALAGRHLPHGLQGPGVAGAEAGQRRPAPRAQVAQPPGTVLEVGLEQEDGVAEAGVAGPLLGPQPRHQAVGRGPGHPGPVQGQEPIAERRSPARKRASSSAVAAVRSVAGSSRASATERTAWPASILASHRGWRMAPASSSMRASGASGHRKTRSQVRVGGELPPPEPAGGQHRDAGQCVELLAVEVVAGQVHHHRLHLGGQLLGQLDTVLAGAQPRGGVGARGRHPGGQGGLRPRFEVAVFARGHRRGDRILNARARPCRQRRGATAQMTV